MIRPSLSSDNRHPQCKPHWALWHHPGLIQNILEVFLFLIQMHIAQLVKNQTATRTGTNEEGLFKDRWSQTPCTLVYLEICFFPSELQPQRSPGPPLTGILTSAVLTLTSMHFGSDCLNFDSTLISSSQAFLSSNSVHRRPRLLPSLPPFLEQPVFLKNDHAVGELTLPASSGSWQSDF